MELFVEDDVVGSLNTVLDPDQEEEAQRLAKQVVEGLESGRLEPTVAALEPFATRLP